MKNGFHNISNKVNYIADYDYSQLKRRAYFWFWIFLGITILICFIFGIVQVSITFGTQESSILATVLNSLVIGVYLNLIGLLKHGIQSQNIKYIILVIGIFLILSGLGSFSINFTFNIWFLSHKTFSTATIDGALFLIAPPSNFLIFSSIIWISFLFESNYVSKNRVELK